MSHTPQVFELFPTPLMRVPQWLDAAFVQTLRSRFEHEAQAVNDKSSHLSHTRILTPDEDPLLQELLQRLQPHLVEFGVLLFGERLQWRVKETWVNLLYTGGQQTVHSHANAFVSGVVYLSEPHASANTLFIRSLGGRDYVFANTHAQAQMGPFNADKWRGPQPAAGDLILFPSSLLHEVPVNQGGLRISLAFNAIPHQLNAWGYRISFG